MSDQQLSMNRAEECGTCRFWTTNEQILRRMEWESLDKSTRGDPPLSGGFCRRYPPTRKPLKLGDDVIPDLSDLTNRFPYTAEYEWCGEYKRVEE